MITLDKRKIGKKGERLAAGFLKRAGYRILCRNGHFSHNELDLVAADKQYVVFVEVKTRSYDSPEAALQRPALAVDAQKRSRTVAAAFAYLKEHPTKKVPRFDVIEVYLDRSRRLKPFKFNHIIDAFQANGRIRP